MKRAIITFCLAFFCIYAINAQDLTSKRGAPILPEKGDYSFSIDAVPFFEYFGNMFHGNNASSAPTFDFPGLSGSPLWTFQAKKFINANTAFRARIRLGFSDNTIKNTIEDETNTGSTPTYVDDKWTETKMNIVLGAGIEKRKGKGRVQGLYGAMANIMLSTDANKLVYGNAMSSVYTNPLSTTYPWVSEGNGSYATENTSARVTSDNKGMGFGIGVNAFLGVEYFFAPKMSIGGEFSWGILVQINGKSKIGSESYNGTDVTNSTYNSGGATYFGIDNGNSGGSINLNFYF